jgi:hypothetical protein
MLGLALVTVLTLASSSSSSSPSPSPSPPDLEPPPGLPRDPHAGLAPIEQDPFDPGPPRESRTWMFVSVGLGGGSSRLGPLATEAAVEGHFFVLPSVSIGARLGVLAVGEPDGNGASGRFLTGLVGYRFRLVGDETRVDGPSATWLQLGGGAGWMGLNGYVMELGQRHDFALDRLLLAGRAAVVWARGVFGAAIGLDLLGVPREGIAALPTLAFGFLF